MMTACLSFCPAFNMPVAQGDGVAVDAGARVAGGDGEPRLEIAGVEHCQLLHERDDHYSPVHGDVSDLRVELDVVYLEKKMLSLRACLLRTSCLDSAWGTRIFYSVHH